jgi:hypothetical protein
MKRTSLLFAAVLAGCSGAILPVAQDTQDGGGAANDAGQSSQDGAAADSSTPPLDGGLVACPADAGGNTCLCGSPVCVNGQWTCSPTPCVTQPDSGTPSDTCNPPCASGSICIRDQVLGGPLVLPEQGPDGGLACPTGRHVENDQCVNDPTFTCMGAPHCLGIQWACTTQCLSQFCTQQQSCMYQCKSATPGQVNCECDVP